MTAIKIKTFQKIIWDFYEKNKRNFPWRQTTDPYKILISEVMLQQTQTYRVLPKYEAWIERFSNFEQLAKAPFSEVLEYWHGLGYNRRALYLQKTAQKVLNDYNGTLPLEPKLLQTFPGIGKYTASAIVVFASNKPLPFIETNIRRVFIHEFFKDKQTVHDKEILKLVEQIVDKENPRDWYYALMDYGVYLGKITTNPNRKSKHYTKQSKFEGSLRQIRGKILKILLERKKIPFEELKKQLPEDNRFKKALSQLEQEGFVYIKEKVIKLNN